MVNIFNGKPNSSPLLPELLIAVLVEYLKSVPVNPYIAMPYL
jgi:hypothetical protein